MNCRLCSKETATILTVLPDHTCATWCPHLPVAPEHTCCAAPGFPAHLYAEAQGESGSKCPNYWFELTGAQLALI